MPLKILHPGEYASLEARTTPTDTPTSLRATPAAEACHDPALSSFRATAPDAVSQSDIDLILETLLRS